MYTSMILVAQGPLLTVDWPLTEIIELFKLQKPDDECSKEQAVRFANDLDTFSVLVDKIDALTVFKRILVVVLSCSNIFFEPKIVSGIERIVEWVRDNLTQHDGEAKNLYRQVAKHFESSSYGSIAFTKFLMFPLMKKDGGESPAFVKTPLWTSLF